MTSWRNPRLTQGAPYGERENATMFNQLAPSSVVRGIGATARAVARGDGALSEFDRDQLMSAYSATRHLAVELDRYEPEFARFCGAVLERLRSAGDDGGLAAATAEKLSSDPSRPAVGDALCELLATLRDQDDPALVTLRTDLRAEIRRLADREVDVVAEGLR